MDICTFFCCSFLSVFLRSIWGNIFVWKTSSNISVVQISVFVWKYLYFIFRRLFCLLHNFSSAINFYFPVTWKCRSIVPELPRFLLKVTYHSYCCSWDGSRSPRHYFEGFFFFFFFGIELFYSDFSRYGSLYLSCLAFLALVKFVDLSASLLLSVLEKSWLSSLSIASIH